MAQTNHFKKIVSGTLMVFVAYILTFILGYFLRMVLARNLSLEQFGLFYSVFSFIAFFSLFRSFGLELALTKFVSEFNAKKDDNSVKSNVTVIFTLKILFSAAIAITFACISNLLAQHYFKSQDATFVLILLLFNFVAIVFLEVFSSIFLGLQKTSSYITIEILRNVLVLGSTITLFYFGLKIHSPAISYMLGSIIVAIFLVIYHRKIVSKYYDIKQSFNIKVIKNALQFSLPIFFGSVISSLISYMDMMLLTYFRPLDEIGLYSAALSLGNILALFSVALVNIVFPIITQLYASKQNKKIRTGLELFYKNIFFILLPIAILMIIFNKFILLLLFGEKFIPVSDVLIVLVIGFLFYSLGSINLTFLNGINKPRIATKVLLIACICDIILSLTLIPKFGMMGAAIGVSMTFVIIFILSLIQLKNIITFKIPVKIWIMNILLGGIYFVILIIMQKYLVIPLVLKIIVMLLTSTAAYIFLGKISKIESIVLIVNFFTKK